MDRQKLPVAVIGPGPVGLAAAAHLIDRGFEPVVLERGEAVGQSVREWGHVRMFSPWKYVVDRVAEKQLKAAGWDAPDETILPTGSDLVTRYLEPLAALPDIGKSIRLNARVVAVSRQLADKVKDSGREQMPFVVRYADAEGEEHELRAQAVIDASGTWTQPNRMGASGLSALGESKAATQIHYGNPDVKNVDRALFAGKRTLVIGTGHSAINAILDLLELVNEEPDTIVYWGMRRHTPGNAFGGGDADGLPARGQLGARLREHVEARRVRLLAGLRIGAIERTGDKLLVRDVDGTEAAHVDRIIVATGARPDLDFLRELRLDLDPAIESPRALAPLIDPNLHSCGSVRPHGAFELEQPERGFFIVGMKSYGRAPTFLLATGYEQVRSVTAYLAGDHAAAREVMLELPETGVCNVNIGGGPAAEGCCGAAPGKETIVKEIETGKSESSCCGGPAPAEKDACCVKDAEAKESGASGCGCSTSKPAPKESQKSSCCA